MSDKTILREIILSPDPFVTANELADRIGQTRQNTNRRLRKLAECGFVDRKDVGSRAVGYWITEEGRRYVADSGDSDSQ